LLLHIHAFQHFSADFFAIDSRGPSLWNTLRWHIQESIQVDAHGGIEHPPQQLDRWHTLQGLMQGIGGGQCVVHGLPVAELIRCMKTCHAHKRGMSHG
jgi:hypothetical protein